MSKRWIFALLVAVAGCNSAAAAPADCVKKLMAINPGSGAAEQKLFGSMCEALTPQQRSCVVAANGKAELDKCVAGAKVK
jgi:hypothetical protein